MKHNSFFNVNFFIGISVIVDGITVQPSPSSSPDVQSSHQVAPSPSSSPDVQSPHQAAVVLEY